MCIIYIYIYIYMYMCRAAGLAGLDRGVRWLENILYYDMIFYMTIIYYARILDTVYYTTL